MRSALTFLTVLSWPLTPVLLGSAEDVLGIYGGMQGARSGHVLGSNRRHVRCDVSHTEWLCLVKQTAWPGPWRNCSGTAFEPSSFNDSSHIPYATPQGGRVQAGLS